jgi:CxxC motif-containing protein (DUF1111 family)
MKRRLAVPILTTAIAGLFLYTQQVASQSTLAFRAQDPGVRGGPAGAGGALTGLTPKEQQFFASAQANFGETEAAVDGLGPTMNLDGCATCHAQPANGGTSPALNPQVAFAHKLGATNVVPSFVSANGPVREARFVTNPDGSPDGGVHALFTIAGRSDARGCHLAQEDFATQVRNKNVIFRIPTPVFGAGLIEQIPDSTILANQAADLSLKQPLGILGRVNKVAVSGETNNNGNDGTIARFGWKAQNKSLLLFSGEAYNVEMGITNEIFQTERDETPTCQFATVPNSVINTEAATPVDTLSDIENFAIFQRFLAAPTPSTTTPGGADSITRGRGSFSDVGCALCHTPSMKTGNSTIAALRLKTANLYSDLLVHDMGSGLADGVSQGQANGREFRSAPLWGVGQRIFFLHDGRTGDLLEAIQAHQSGSTRTGDASEANGVINNFNNLSERQKQDILNFLRSL